MIREVGWLTYCDIPIDLRAVEDRYQQSICEIVHTEYALFAPIRIVPETVYSYVLEPIIGGQPLQRPVEQGITRVSPRAP